MTLQALVTGLLQEDGMHCLCVPSSSGPGVQWCQPASGMQEGRAHGGLCQGSQETLGSECSAVG